MQLSDKLGGNLLAGGAAALSLDAVLDDGSLVGRLGQPGVERQVPAPELGLGPFPGFQALLDPGVGDDYYTLGLSPYHLEHWEAAEAAWKQLLERQPQHVSANKGLAVLYWTVGDYEAAWQAMERCRRFGISVGGGFIQDLERDSGRSE